MKEEESIARTEKKIMSLKELPDENKEEEEEEEEEFEMSNFPLTDIRR